MDPSLRIFDEKDIGEIEGVQTPVFDFTLEYFGGRPHPASNADVHDLIVSLNEKRDKQWGETQYAG